MMKLICFELEKIWKRKQLIILIIVIMLTNIFLHWYNNRPIVEVEGVTDARPGLQSYKKVVETMADMKESEKYTYLQTMAEDLECIRRVDMIVWLMEGDKDFLEKVSEENQEIFQKWYPVYKKGDYLTYTDTLYQEIKLIDEMYEEAKQVTHYKEYLQEMKQNKEELNSISIFANKNEKTFSGKNIKKSAEDYKERTEANVRWIPSKGLVSAIDSPITSILYFITIFLFAIWGIMEEKDKKLFFVTRITNKGVLHNGIARIAALGISCVFLSILLYGCNYVWYGIQTGFCDVSLDIQSVSAYMQSCYNLTIGQFVVLSVFTKAVVAFGFGLLLQCITILNRRKMMPFVVGIVILISNTLLYELLPAVGVLSPFKHLNIIGIFHTENLYGDYLNFNIGEIPVSRMWLSLLLLFLLVVIGCIVVIVAFCCGKNFYFVQRPRRRWISFKPHNNLFRYESYKMFITNRAILVFVGCLVVTGAYYTSQNYSLSAKEQYYKDLMMNLEGELTKEKEQILLAEKKRYDNAFEELDYIEEMLAADEISELKAEERKDILNEIVAFYPSFQRAWWQYEHILEQGGVFVYDTGYLYMFGAWGKGFLSELFIFSIGILLMFSNFVSMEYQNKTNLLICSSTFGMKKVLQKKAWLCVLVGICLPVCIRIFYGIHIHNTFPTHFWNSSIHEISQYQNIPVDIPIWTFFIVIVSLQILVCSILALSVMFLSYWRKNFMQTILIGAIIFVVPIALYFQGIEFTKYLSVYPLYSLFGK